ncbi:hypothetical protein B0A55_07829 [Friedmanniomyces simplex]|uniref:Uncharacterized protein n=1 Tax=Friedmanniomyces simplex TaxID=329884 RepID=A0A4U0WXU4_9PEZI|nr:hypothetical protein B0A55_07829 [Friedmanniomyces simplex]
MSKLSEPLKAFINAAHARPNTTPAPRHIASVYEKIAKDAGSKQVGMPAWLTASTAATMTLNSPQSLLELYGLATSSRYNKGQDNKVWTAELMREVGLKCIGLNGVRRIVLVPIVATGLNKHISQVPRTINSLGAFYNGLPPDVQTELQKRKPRRHLTTQTITPTLNRGNALWESVYRPFSAKLTAKLAQSHPDLPVFIIEAEYGALFSDPAYPSPQNSPQNPSSPKTSQIHIFGLRKAYEDGTAAAEGEVAVEGGEWLAGNEGAMWLLELVDGIVEAIGGGRGTSFAPGIDREAPRAKL